MHFGHLNYLACPHCRTELPASQTTLICDACQRQFTYFKDIPILSTQMVLNPRPPSTDIATALFSRYLQSADQKGDSTWPDFLKNFIQAVSNLKNANNLVLKMVDETQAVFKFLLNISPGDHVLNIGPGADNTTISLARTAAKVTVLDLDMAGLWVLMLKKKHYGLDNIDLILGGDEKNWPLRDHAFDAVIVQDSLIWSLLTCGGVRGHIETGRLGGESPKLDRLVAGRHHSAVRLPVLLAEIKRVLKSAGAMFLGIQPYRNVRHVQDILTKRTVWLDTDTVLNGSGNLIKQNMAVFADRRRFECQLKRSGFSPGKAYQITAHHEVPERMVELPVVTRPPGLLERFDGILKSFRKARAARYNTIIGHTAFGSTAGQSWIQGMLLDLSAAKGIVSKCPAIQHLHISRKGKLVVMLRDMGDQKNSWVIKVPFHDQARGMLEKNYQTLEYLAGVKPILKKRRPPLQEAVPRGVYAGTYKGQAYFVEQGIYGVAWKSLGRTGTDQIIWRQMAELLDSFTRLSVADEAKETTLSNYKRRFACIETLLHGGHDSEKKTWEAIKDLIIEALNHRRERDYFRKGDVSMHNIIIRPDKNLGLIDFDESGTTPFKAVDLADLLFSYARIRKGIGRAAFLKIVLRREFKKLGTGLPPGEIIGQLSAGTAELAIASLISWIDQVYYAIQFEPIKYRKYILKQSFGNTLNAVAPVTEIISDILKDTAS